MSVSFDSDVTLTVEIAFGDDALTASPTWTDVSAYARGFGIRRGRSHELDTISPGVLTLDLSNSDGRFDPTYTSGAYYPNVVPMKQIRVRAAYNAVTYDLFRGFITAWPQSWPSRVDAVTTVEAMDGFKILALRYTNTAESEEASNTRIGNLLDDAAWPAGWRSLSTGVATVAAHTPTCESILSLIRQVEDTEAGLFYIDGAGVAVFQARDDRHEPTSAATFGDDTGELPYVDLVLGYDDTQIWNRVEVSTVDGSNQSVEDTASVTAYAKRTLKVGGTLHTTTTAALEVAYSMIHRYKNPAVRVESITVTPRVSPSGLWPQALGLDISDYVTVKRRPPAGNTISTGAYIEGVEHQVTAGKSWVTRFNLSQYADRYWIIEDATYGAIDSVAVMAPPT